MHKTVVLCEYLFYNSNMKFCLIINNTKPLAEAFAHDFIGEIEKRDFSYYLFNGKIEDGTDFAVVFGGDGTILKFARSIRVNVPILGVNCGKMGFLAESGKSAAEYLDELVKGNYYLDKRCFLEVECLGEKYYALNEVVIGRSDTINLMDISIDTEGGSLDHYRADGVIVSTPTGSTAYSLSAGGPVLSPRVPAFVVTPICPHSLQSKAIVLPREETIEIEALSQGKCVVVVDGVGVVSRDNALRVRVTGSSEGVSFVRIDKRSFYTIMLSKFAKGK